VYKNITTLLSVVILGFGSLSANAAIIDLFDWGFNIDSIWSNDFTGDPIPGNVDVSLFDLGTGIGQIDITITGIGVHNALTFLDHEIDESINTFFNESASIGGALMAGQSWEADEPGFLFGDIVENAAHNTLDNANGVPAGLEDDVSMALGWDFALVDGETAVASFFTSTINDAAGSFFIEQFDPDSNASIFFWSGLDISAEPPAGLTEPGTLGLVLFGMLSVFGLRRRKTH